MLMHVASDLRAFLSKVRHNQHVILKLLISIYTGLGPHVDAGSLSRWADPSYRRVYHRIFAGFPEDHNPFDMTARKSAKQDIFGGSAHSSVLRAFQGWTALTEAGAKEGSLLVYPNLKYALAYMLLRPFFDPPSDSKDILDAERWTLNVESMFFPGVSSSV